jgi:citrate lyase beta subunit
MFALACRANGIVSVDSPYTKFKDIDGLRIELEYLKQIGIKGKFAIHPTQVAPINEAFMPSKEYLDFARRLVD